MAKKKQVGEVVAPPAAGGLGVPAAAVPVPAVSAPGGVEPIPAAVAPPRPGRLRPVVGNPGVVRDVGRFHQLRWGGGQVTVSKELTARLPWDSKSKLLLELEGGVLRLSLLNP
jgi:hypothetical protein